MKKSLTYVAARLKEILAVALLAASTAVATAQSDLTVAQAQQPTAVQGAQSGPSDELPAQMTQEQAVASARATIEQVKEAAKANGQHSQKLERQLDKVAAELDNMEKNGSAQMQENKGASKLTTLPARMLAKKALKKAERSGVFEGKDVNQEKAAKELNTLTIVGLVLAVLGLIFLFINGLLGLIFLIVGLVLLLVGLLQ